jgi:hypothetical protein
MDDTFAEAIGFVPWGPSETLRPAWLPTSADTYNQPPTHDEPKLRVLPDGSPQLALRNSAGARVVRVGDAPVQVTAELVRDAVTTPDGTIVLLEQVGFDKLALRGVRPDGTTLWQQNCPDAEYNSRLLTDSQGRVFVAIGGSLIQVDESASTVFARLPGSQAVLCPDGRIGYVRAGHWVVRDLGTGSEEETALGSDLEERDLREVIGVDASGRVYWRGCQTIARMLPDGDIDWLIHIGGIAVSERHGVTVLTYSDDSRVARFASGGRVSIDLPSGDLDDRSGRLAGRGDDGEYVLYKLIWQRPYREPDGQLTYLDREGRPLRTELAPDDIWLTMDISQQPDFSSVTPDGAVLVAVNSELGVHVVRLTPGRAAEQAGQVPLGQAR